MSEEKKENPETVAVCLSCSNEWIVRDPGVKKKRKCPVCGKYRVKLKSDMKAASLSPSPKTEPVVVVEEKKEIPEAPKLEAPKDEAPQKEEQIQEKQVKPKPVKPRNPHRRERIAAPVEEKQEERIEERTEEKGEEKGGGSLLYAAIAVFIVGAIIGVYFLWYSSRKKPDSPPKDEKRIAVHPGIKRMMGAL